MTENTIIKKKRINSKSKGAGNELKLSKVLAEHLAPLKFVRTQGSGNVIGGKNFGSRSHLFSQQTMEHYVGDVVASNEEAVGLKFNWVIETKFYKEAPKLEHLMNGKNNILGWLNEVDIDKVKVEKAGIVIFRFNGTPYYCAVRPEVELPSTVNAMTLPTGDKVCYLTDLLTHKDFWCTETAKA